MMYSSMFVGLSISPGEGTQLNLWAPKQEHIGWFTICKFADDGCHDLDNLRTGHQPPRLGLAFRYICQAVKPTPHT